MSASHDLRMLLITSRPLGWIAGPLVFLLGASLSAHQAGQSELSLSVVMCLQIAVLSLPLCLFGYGINDFFDEVSDGPNTNKGLAAGVPLEGQARSRVWRASLWMLRLLLAASVLAFDAANFFAMLVLVCCTWAYSVPPIRLKGRPPFDSLANGLIYGWAPYALGHSFFQPLDTIPAQAWWLALGAAGAHAYGAVRDRPYDEHAGTATVAVKLGSRTTLLLTGVVWASILLCGEFETWTVGALVIWCLSVVTVNASLPGELLERFAATGLALIAAGFLLFAIVFLFQLSPSEAR